MAAGLTAYTAIHYNNIQDMAETKSIKDYSGKTAMEWLELRKWTGFLMRIPLDKTKGYPCKNANDAMSIRATASMLNNNDECDRKFKVVVDFETKIVTVTATKKNQEGYDSETTRRA